ncbi:NUDIX domain-containing protein [Nocardioides sp.]|uniref:NUDIX domain-containing protein n=1 Tax=Nocardioides sp. TaxID=35761 RepID=UPI00351924B7
MSQDPTLLADEPAAWRVVDSVDLHRDDWVMALRADRVQRPGATHEPPFRRLVLEHPGAAVVLALDDEDRVLVLRQYRHPVQARLLELPAGLLDAGDEEPLEVARRELVEEAAMAAGEWTHLLSMHSTPGISQEMIHYFRARDLSPSDRGDFALQHEEADLEVIWVPFTELVDIVLEGRTADGPLAIAVLTELARRGR